MLPACDEPFDDGVGKVAGFSLHAGVAARADERKKLERLCRYITRPAVSVKRLSLTTLGQVRYELNPPLARRHHSCDLRAPRLHRQTGSSCTQTQSDSDQVYRPDCLGVFLMCCYGLMAVVE